MADLIDRGVLRQKFLDIQEDVCKHCCINFDDYDSGLAIGYSDMISACINELDDCPSIWHKPNEKPQESSRVLVWFKDYTFASGFILWDSAYYSEETWSTGFDEDINCETKIPQEYIIAWMYFPELPEDFV